MYHRVGVRAGSIAVAAGSRAFLKSAVPRVAARAADAVRVGETKRWCGLFAALDLVGRYGPVRTDERLVKDRVDIIKHRGPDGQFTEFGSFGNDGGRWALGHARLSIVAPDESAANQPFVLPNDHGPSRSERGGDGKADGYDVANVALVANGEIYNHEKLFADIVARGYPADARRSRSDCEVIPHAYRALGAEAMVKALDGMFAFVLVDEEKRSIVAGRDPTGIKPLYYGVDDEGNMVAFASELKALVGMPAVASLHEFPNGHFYTTEGGFQKYYDPAWKRYCQEGSSEAEAAPWKHGLSIDGEEVREALDAAVTKRLMSDVEFGMFLSGGIDSCITGQLMLKRCHDMGIRHPKSFTVGMADSPDLIAARAMAERYGTDHHERIFGVDEAFDIVDKVVYHIETFNAELIRSAIPNYFLAQMASQHVRMVITGEGADELWAGYAYFEDAPSPEHLHNELVRIYGHLGVANLLRTDRMTMAHGLEARVPFLDTVNTAAVMSVDPAKKMLVKGGTERQREKAYLRHLFEREHGGVSIPQPVLWRMKAMQCEGVGEDWVSHLQAHLAAQVSDADMASAAERWPYETPQTKEEYYYRRVFERHYPGCEQIPTLWEGGCRAGGAAWKSTAYTRHGLADTSRLTHSLQDRFADAEAPTAGP